MIFSTDSGVVGSSKCGSELGVGHDGGRIEIDEDDAEAFLLEGFAGLGAGIIKFAGLADDDRAGADNEDAVWMSVRLGMNQTARLNTD